MPKKKTSIESATLKLRNEQLIQLEEAIKISQSRLHQCREDHRNQLKLLDSVSAGLYDEIDKLAKKAPAEPVTDLALNQINDVIRETKQLIESDTYIQRLNEFVPAGDNPQHRDAVIVLRQIRQGLERFRNQLDSIINLLGININDAKGLQIAIQINLDGEDIVSREDLKENGVDVSAAWLLGEFKKYVNFTKLDRINISEYFTEAKLP